MTYCCAANKFRAVRHCLQGPRWPSGTPSSLLASHTAFAPALTRPTVSCLKDFKPLHFSLFARYPFSLNHASPSVCAVLGAHPPPPHCPSLPVLFLQAQSAGHSDIFVFGCLRSVSTTRWERMGTVPLTGQFPCNLGPPDT